MSARRSSLVFFVVGLAVGVLVGLVSSYVLARLGGGGVQGNMTRVGSVSVDGLHVDVYANFTRRGGVVVLDTLVARYWYSRGLPGGSGVCYCSCSPVKP